MANNGDQAGRRLTCAAIIVFPVILMELSFETVLNGNGTVTNLSCLPPSCLVLRIHLRSLSASVLVTAHPSLFQTMPDNPFELYLVQHTPDIPEIIDSNVSMYIS